jgi:hypothetical protein
MPEPKISSNGRTITVRVPISIRRRGGRKLVLAPHGAEVTAAHVTRHVDDAMVKAIAGAFRWREMLENGTHATIAEIAAAEKINESLYGAFEVKHLFHSILRFLHPSFFVRLGIPVCIAKRARAGAVKVGRRSNPAARTDLAWPHLYSFEHDGPLDAVGMTIRGEPAFRARIYRATTLYSVGPRTRTMMQSCASAAKLRGGGPILRDGVISHGVIRVTATSNRHRQPVTSGRTRPKLLGAFSILRS